MPTLRTACEYEAGDELAYYASPGPLTAVKVPELNARTVSTEYILQVVRGLTLHELNASLYGVELPRDRRGLQHVRPAEALLDRIRELDPRPLIEQRPPDRRLATYCRHLALITVALLRAAAIPARARCGFCPSPSGDSEPGRFIDHWWVERWHHWDRRWVVVDPGLDPAVVQLDFDPGDLPPGRYLSGADAWTRCSAGEADPDSFGVATSWGAWMVRNNVVRDLAALNKVELLPWDFWGLMDHESSLGKGAADPLVDEVAEAVLEDDWPRLRQLYQHRQELWVPRSLIDAPVGAYPDWAG